MQLETQTTSCAAGSTTRSTPLYAGDLLSRLSRPKTSRKKTKQPTKSLPRSSVRANETAVVPHARTAITAAHDHGAELFRKVQVVLVQRVLGARSAADHAGRGKVAARPLGTLAVKIGIGYGFAGFRAKENADRRGAVGV